MAVAATHSHRWYVILHGYGLNIYGAPGRSLVGTAGGAESALKTFREFLKDAFGITDARLAIRPAQAGEYL